MHLPRRSQLLILAGTLAAFSLPAPAENFYVVQGETNVLLQVDPDTGNVIGGIGVALPGEGIHLIKGLAAHPVTGELWMTVSLRGQSGLELVRVDPRTGSVARIGGPVTSSTRSTPRRASRPR